MSLYSTDGLPHGIGHHIGRCQVAGASGELHLNGSAVGRVMVTGRDASWGFGRFAAGPGFVPFAALYRTWAGLMHVGPDEGWTRERSAQLSRAENLMDRIHGRLYFAEFGQWVGLFQLNIDGDVLEWKEY